MNGNGNGEGNNDIVIMRIVITKDNKENIFKAKNHTNIFIILKDEYKTIQEME